MKIQVLFIKLGRNIAFDISHILSLKDACSFETIFSTRKI